MKKNNTFFSAIVIIFFSFLIFTNNSTARKVICIDQDPNDNGFLSNHEGWERQNLKPGDIIMVGGPLDSCLKKVMNGDTLIIIAHGWGMGRGFKWGGTFYRGFGTGDSLHPVPPGFNNLMNVHVKFCSCWSNRDPDGTGPDKPLTEKIKEKMGPPTNGNTAEGYTNRALAGVCVQYNYYSDVTDTATINNFIRNGNSKWKKCPPVNRVPPSPQNQLTCLQTLLDSVKGGAGKVTATGLTYKMPYNEPGSVLDSCNCNCNSDDFCGCASFEILSTPFCTGPYSWSDQPSGTLNDLYTVSAVSFKIAWAAGVGPTVIKTLDGGLTWTSALGTGIIGDVYNIFGVSDEIAFCATTPSSSNIYKTTNGGTTWTAVFTQPGGFINCIRMISPLVGYAVGDPVGGKWTVLRTLDGGNSWSRMATEPLAGGSEFGWNNALKILGSDIWFGTNSGVVYHSTDLGITWSSSPTSGTVNSYAVHFNNNAFGLAGGDGMSSSFNGGMVWSPTGLPGVSGDVTGLEGNGNDWWSIRSGSSVYYSSNQGASWSTVHTYGGINSFFDLNFTIESACLVGWSVGTGGSISKMSGTQFSSLNLTALIEGFWDGVLNISDTLKVYIRKTVSPYITVDSAYGVNNGSGNLTLYFNNVQIQNGDPYYIMIRHRNSIETWSKSGGEIWTGSLLNYDMTASASRGYGGNLTLKGGKYCIYGGDVDQNGVVDLTDASLVDNDIFNFGSGYIQTDLNGDNIIDLADAVITDNNAFNFVSKVTP
ncbi:MAG: hypothetical protein JSS91_13695 [Bacteroidetes bacterium]|nr:hypothetical protein [Bacteroidota bacterium]